MMYSVRLLRNAASHHNCLLIPPSEDIKATRDLDKYLELLVEAPAEHAASVKELAKTDPLVHDFASLVLAHLNLVKSGAAQDMCLRQAEEFVRRMERHIDWYRDPACGCERLVWQLDAIRLLIQSAIAIHKRDNDGALTDSDREILRQPHRKPVRRGRRKSSAAK